MYGIMSNMQGLSGVELTGAISALQTAFFGTSAAADNATSSIEGMNSSTVNNGTAVEGDSTAINGHTQAAETATTAIDNLGVAAEGVN